MSHLDPWLTGVFFKINSENKVLMVLKDLVGHLGAKDHVDLLALMDPVDPQVLKGLMGHQVQMDLLDHLVLMDIQDPFSKLTLS
ncbi:hypothetical protein L0F63_007447 [Massospora cicadina]|nr:hypothetical protein L0F63_007447 [Massospora cicadina]